MRDLAGVALVKGSHSRGDARNIFGFPVFYYVCAYRIINWIGFVLVCPALLCLLACVWALYCILYCMIVCLIVVSSIPCGSEFACVHVLHYFSSACAVSWRRWCGIPHDVSGHEEFFVDPMQIELLQLKSWIYLSVSPTWSDGASHCMVLFFCLFPSTTSSWIICSTNWLHVGFRGYRHGSVACACHSSTLWHAEFTCIEAEYHPPSLCMITITWSSFCIREFLNLVIVAEVRCSHHHMQCTGFWQHIRSPSMSYIPPSKPPRVAVSCMLLFVCLFR